MLQGRQRGTLGIGEVAEGGWVGRRQRRHEVDARNVVGVPLCDVRADARSPVAALGAVALVAEPGHQLSPGSGDALHAPSQPLRLVAEAVTRQRWADDVEGVRRVATMGGGVSERPDHLEELDDRPRPAVRHNERQRVGMP
jgi:hypothetical protein